MWKQTFNISLRVAFGLLLISAAARLFIAPQVIAQIIPPKPKPVSTPRPTPVPNPKRVPGKTGRNNPTPVPQTSVSVSTSTEYLNGNVKLEMVNLSAGTFTMGSNDGYYKDETPPHRVTVGAFAIGKYEVTQAQWQAVMGKDNNPSRFKGDNLPVENVSWEDAQAFCRKLGNGYRLPTEAEWEYAARAGSTTKWSFGNDENRLGEYAWFSGNSGSQTHPVGQKKPNAFGLFDMHGNVWEWCQDVWHDSYNSAPSDGSAWLSGGDSSLRVLRGGSWNDDGSNCRSASRVRITPGFILSLRGFRLVSARTP